MTASAERNAVVLSGGGANAAYEVGVLKALLEGESPATDFVPLEIDILSGTSIGAFNSALLMSCLDDGPDAAARYLETVWTDVVPRDEGGGRNHVVRYRLNPFDVVVPEAAVDAPMRVAEVGTDLGYLFQQGVRRAVNFLVSAGDLEERLLQLVDLSVFLSREPAERLVRRTVDCDRIRASKRTLRIVATNWETGVARVFRNEEMTDEACAAIVLASSALPGIFPCVELEGGPFVDGGLVMNTPLMPAIDAGADVLHVIYLDPDVSRVPVQRLQSSLDTIDRVFTIGFAVRTNEDLMTAGWVNDGLEVIERVGRGEMLGDADVTAFVRTAGMIAKRLEAGAPYRKLTVHRYHPRDDISGTLGVLKFTRDRIERLIARGYDDAQVHDCKKSGCLLPKGV